MLQDGLLERVEADALTGPGGDQRERVAARQLDGRGPGSLGELPVADEVLVQPGRLAPAQHRQGLFDGRGVGVVRGRCQPAQVQGRARDVALHHQPRHPGVRGERGRGGPDWGGDRGQRPEVLIRQPKALIGPDGAGEREHGIGRAVPAPEEVLHLGEGRGVQVGHRADGGVRVGVFGGEVERHQQFQLVTVGDVVVALSLLLLDDLPLGVEVGLVDREGRETIRLQPERELQRAARDGLEVVRPLEGGGGVHRSPGCLHDGQVLAIPHLVGTGEHQVLEEVGEAGASGLLVPGTHVVPEVHGDAGAGGVGVDDHPQAIGQGGLFDHIVELRRHGCHPSHAPGTGVAGQSSLTSRRGRKNWTSGPMVTA